MGKKIHSDASLEAPPPAPAVTDDHVSNGGWSYAALIDNLPMCVSCKDVQGRITFANRAFAETLGQSAGQLLGKTDGDLFPAELARKYRRDDQRVMETGESFHDVEENCVGDKVRYVEVRKSPLRNAAGEVVGIQVVFWDVTDRKQAEEALENEQYLLHALMDNLPDSIYFKDGESRFIRVSKGQATKFGFPNPKDVVGQTDADIFSEEHAQAARRDELEIMRTGQPMLAKVEKETWENAPTTWCSSTKMPLRDKQGNIVGTFGISRDITDLVKAEEALRRAKEEAVTANRAKSDFLANMSHEIRTPLNAIIGMTELMLDADPTPAQQEYLTMVLASGESLLAIINDVLDFSKIEAGKFDLDPTFFDLRNAIGDTVKSLGLRAHENNLELAYSVAPDVPQYVEGDLGRLRQIVINLVGNAIKFTREGEVILTIECESQVDGDAVLAFSVRDTGIGIPTGKLERIFDEFEQADSSTTRTYGGTGLGLAISSRLVELMGGHITVESQLGVGSTFRFTVRFGVPEKGRQLPQFESEVMRGNRVLIVDDNETNRRILRDMLLNWDLRPVLAVDAHEALHELLTAQRLGQPIPLVLTDVNMPEVDGFMLTESIRREPLLAETRVIMLTSGSRQGDAERCRQLEVAARIIKPVKQSEVFDAIISALGGIDVAGLTPPPAAPALPDVGQLRILLAEDNRVNQKLAVGLLRKQGHEVTVAENGQEAVQAWEADQFDLILMDVQMPQMDGYQATRVIRDRELTAGTHVPIIAMTARAMKGDRERCVAAGMDDYLAKPIRIHQLAEKLASVVKVETHPTAAEPLAPSTPTGEGGVDWEAAMRSVGGNRELLREVIEAFQEDAPRLITTIRQAVEQQDPQLLQRTAHSLKGSALFLHADALIQPAARLEVMGDQQQFDEVRTVLHGLEEAFQSVTLQLQQWLPAES